MTHTVRMLLLAVIAAGAAMGPAEARQVKILTSSPPGSITDGLTRLLQDELKRQFPGDTFVVENRAGALHTLGAAECAKLPVDGNSFCVIPDGGFTFGPAFRKARGEVATYDPLESFDSVMLLTDTPFTLYVNASVPARSLRELVALKGGQKVTVGYGNPTGLSVGLFLRKLGATDIDPVSYDTPNVGEPGAVVALVGGHINALAATNIAVRGPLAEGKILPIASLGRIIDERDNGRNPLLPDLPTFGEQGYPQLDALVAWIALVAPKGAMQAQGGIVAALPAAVGQISKKADVREKLSNMGLKPTPAGPGVLRKLIQAGSQEADAVLKQLAPK